MEFLIDNRDRGKLSEDMLDITDEILKAPPMADKYCLCSETHWDREWHSGFEQFRMRLVKMMDGLLGILRKDSDFTCFNFDGQTVAIDDYLEVRPENEPLLRKYIEDGRLVIGPWYVLADEFLVSGESTIRNLMHGASVGRRFGRICNVGYLPDTFGHISQMPQLLKQWGIDVAVLWRGLSGDEYENELIWQAPDGSGVLVCHIPEETGYCSAALLVASLPPGTRDDYLARGFADSDILTGEDAVNGLLEACRFVKSKSTGHCHILFNGVDHLHANPEIPQLIREANHRLEGGEIVQTSFDEYALRLMEDVKDRYLQVVRGELRDSVWTRNGSGVILNGVLSSRIHLKQWNQKCCTLLENWVEPFSAFAALTGSSYERGFIDRAWRYVLQSHPHDSIGGCSADIVHRQMEYRFESAQDIAESMLEFTFTELLERVRIEVLGDGEYAFAVFNPSQQKQSGWMELKLEIPWTAAKDAPVGTFKGVIVTDMAGREQPSWLIRFEPSQPVNRPSLRTFYVSPSRPVFTVSFWAEDVPACGYRMYKFRPTSKPNCIFGKLAPRRDVMENRYLRAEIKPNGTLRLTDKTTGLTYDDLHYFEDGGDNGGGYAYSFPKDDEVYASLSSSPDIALIENSRARVAYKTTTTLNLPESLDSSKQARSEVRKPLVIESVISLGSGSRRLDIETTVINTVKDHRLRVVFPSYLEADVSSAETQFDVVDHPVEIAQPEPDIWKEDQPRQFPQQTFVSVSDGRKGLAIANIGLPEYEVTPDEDRAIAITLLRAVSHISNAWENTKLHSAICPLETPEAEMLGRKLVFNYSIIPHAGRWYDSHVQREAHNYAMGLKAFLVLYSEGDKGVLPHQFSFLSVDCENTILSSLKLCEDGEGYALRLWNGTDAPSRARVTMFKRPKRAYVSNIREERLDEMPVLEALEIPVLAKEIATVRLEY